MNIPTKWWMWIVMPIASIAGAFVASLCVVILEWLSTMISGNGTNGWHFLYILPIISSIAWGIAYSAIAYTLSPTSKFTATTVMITIWAVIFIILQGYAWLIPADLTNSQLIFATVKGITSIIGSIIGLHLVRN